MSKIKILFNKVKKKKMYKTIKIQQMSKLNPSDEEINIFGKMKDQVKYDTS